ncbi:nucleotidyltransferase family protein [Chelativorans sp. M5D2P16]|uniref:nucleotidyltransferase family protein n=1 Tax=Chelativorans sp. M5D2P16 TaxID=3095678 RepID=UPI002ACA9B45|nr:nucleotidyltransferase domain-containing protein [Chelativorans sp. M5D2P16]MDZ5696780.1 nucleotidyltransferase domain-containing protein [Chelativorans sp. M5D2P16]
MRPSEALARHRDEVLAVISHYPVSNPRVFGSVARGEDGEGSDLDILVDHDDSRLSLFDLAALELKLEALLGVKVDIRTPGDFSTAVAKRVARDERRL